MGLPCRSEEGQGKKPTREIENSIGMKLVLIPPGKFTMGSPQNEKGRNKDEDQREIEIKEAFHLGIHEVTQAQFEKVMGINPSYFSACATGRQGADYESWSKPGGGKDKVKGLGNTTDFPVENVSWHEAVEFCKKLSALPAEQKAGRSYRLPSEAEWEYACRGGASSTQVFHFGNNLSSAQANFRGTMPYGGAAKGSWLERTCKVGSYQPNAFGLYDMHGNVWEWCMDSYEYQGDRGFRVRRGGSWGESGEQCRSAIRLRRAPDDHRWNLGFRIVMVAAAAVPTPAREPAARATKVPRGDARGVCPPAGQGVACLDVHDDATRIALGTIAPAGDPNVLLLDGNGKLLRQQRAGQRWINQVALGTDEVVRAVSTMPAGRAGDMPEVFRLGTDGVTAEAIAWRRGQYADGYFHYGDHSNHVTRLLTRMGPSAVVVNGDQVHWLGAAGKAVSFPLQPTAIPVAVAGDPTGVVVVGTTATPSKQDEAPPNLHVLASSQLKPLWSRPLNPETVEASRLERGRYGTPTLPDGRREELPQRDDKVWVPLAVAVHVAGAKRLVAAADYQGWQRWVRSSATGQDENLGVRFMPARPAVTVYDQDGKAIRRFALDTFAHPFWCDLRFGSDGKWLLAWPLSWTSRGLAGQALLPADADAADLYTSRGQDWLIFKGLEVEG
jgi:formylglycine-generating enzyme required for sulfatase activity